MRLIKLELYKPVDYELIGSILWEEESAIISQMAANGNKAILINPIFQMEHH
jgi:hypothetical protein